MPLFLEIFEMTSNYVLETSAFHTFIKCFFEFGAEVDSEEMCPLISFNQMLKSVFVLKGVVFCKSFHWHFIFPLQLCF